MKKFVSVFLIAGVFSTLTSISLAKSFEDVPADGRIYNAVDYVSERGIFNGTSQNEFSPKAEMTRAMLVTGLHNFEKKPAGKGEVHFSDVSENNWYTKAIYWAYGEGIIAGYGDGKFGVDDSITRQQAITILYNYAKIVGINTIIEDDTNFADYLDYNKIEQYAIVPMKWGLLTGVFEVREDGLIAPDNKATREELAVMMQNICKYIEKDRQAKEEAGAPVKYLIKSNTNGNLSVKLVGNPSTGYCWYASNYDDKIIKIEGTDIGEYAGAKEGVIGKNQIYNFRVTGLSEGETTVIFKYYRSWVPDAVLRTLTLTLNVDKDKQVSVVSEKYEENGEKEELEEEKKVEVEEKEEVKEKEEIEEPEPLTKYLVIPKTKGGLRLELDSNLSTGYSWSASEYDNEIIKVIGSETEREFDVSSGVQVVEVDSEILSVTPIEGKNSGRRAISFDIDGLNKGKTDLVFKYSKGNSEDVTRILQFSLEVDENNNIKVVNEEYTDK